MKRFHESSSVIPNFHCSRIVLHEFLGPFTVWILISQIWLEIKTFKWKILACGSSIKYKSLSCDKSSKNSSDILTQTHLLYTAAAAESPILEMMTFFSVITFGRSNNRSPQAPKKPRSGSAECSVYIDFVRWIFDQKAFFDQIPNSPDNPALLKTNKDITIYRSVPFLHWNFLSKFYSKKKENIRKWFK